MAKPKTLFDKIWDSHLVEKKDDGTCILYIDRQIIHEITSAQAFDGLRENNRQVRVPDAHLLVAEDGNNEKNKIFYQQMQEQITNDAA